jgi:pyridoxamine 5'-phosphate oxidase
VPGEAVREFTLQHEGREIPRPEFWVGYTIQPERIEFWADGSDRLHHRLLYTRAAEAWEQCLLYP